MKQSTQKTRRPEGEIMHDIDDVGRRLKRLADKFQKDVDRARRDLADLADEYVKSGT